ncbi:hypothetical protein BDZ85DRAFT_305615 [Elsinoe ampelina]|uniref:Alcohol acetyltransferase n=1 Tax=Elsinoe ampelina TaxID=302913 RepID=A0A6A6GLA7_9PEZI|nr:hypothetical protein BDZ85DRAFT_305615 [Elsinoe ampelina]
MDWLRRYASDYHAWRKAEVNGHTVHYRPLGVVETGFDADGLYNEGRADITMTATFEIKSKLSKDQLRRRILLAWTNLRLSHTLLGASAHFQQEYMVAPTAIIPPRFCVIQTPKDPKEAIERSHHQLIHMDDHFSDIEIEELYHHSQNSSRIVDPAVSLSKLFVLPLIKTGTDTWSLRFMFIMGHQISDGLTNNTWIQHFMHILNKPVASLESDIPSLLSTFHTRLPLPQEDLYPPIPGSRARQRWYWAITLILRHVHKPNPPTFTNPLCYPSPIPATLPSQPTFSPLLPYVRPPTLNAGNVTARLSTPSTQRLHHLCRQTSCSLGAGSFVLVAIVMMELYETRHPSIPTAQRLPFGGSFPINPRPFFNHTSEPDSMMLAFSDGVVLPFLPSSLDLDGRIRLLVRSAQRQLSRYQKRPRKISQDEDERAVGVRHWGPTGAGRVIANNYIDAVDRQRTKLPVELQKGAAPGGALGKTQAPRATCGVSSVGRGNPGLAPGQYDLGREVGEGEDAFVADIRAVKMGVRPRDGEFLVGIGGDEKAIGSTASFDACAIDPEWAERWRVRMETILETEKRAKL